MAAICGGMPALTRGPRLVVPDVIALRLVLADSGRATVLVSFVPDRGSVVEFVSILIASAGDGGFVPFCTETEGGTLVPVFADSRPEEEFVAAPAIWTPG